MTRVKNVEEASAKYEQSLAHKLLIELLSYQFAYPVQWIETQQQLLQNGSNIERVVEIGPSKVLATMAKKTLNILHSRGDASSSTELQFLSHSEDKAGIFYEYDEPVMAEETPPSAPLLTSTSAVPVTVIPPPQPVTVVVESSPGVAVSDSPLSATDIILSIVAQKLKKPFDQVSLQSSIRDLSKGKSTLQNELIGDLGAEFGDLPDASEELPLGDIGTALQAKFAGKPNKHIAALISKLITSKMPAGFNQTSIKDYLESYWGLIGNRQTTLLCLAITAEPPARIPTIEAGKAFFDTIVNKYATYAGISLAPTSRSSVGSSSSSSPAIDSAAQAAMEKDRKEYLMKQFKLLAQHLGIDTNNVSTPDSDVVDSDTMKLLKEEFGDAMLTGVEPKFSSQKARTYESWWNWAREGLLSLFAAVEKGSICLENEDTLHRISLLSNKWDPTYNHLLEFQLHSAIQSKSKSSNMVRKIADLLLSSTTDRPMFRYVSSCRRPRTSIDAAGTIKYEEVEMKCLNGLVEYHQVVKERTSISSSSNKSPYVHVRQQSSGKWIESPSATTQLLETLAVGCKSGISFAGKTVLVTGAGPASIGAEIVRGLLCGGATVVVTTSRTPSSIAQFYQEMYRRYGGQGSRLILLPFNQGSKSDCEALINHIYDTKGGLGYDLDFVIPFAAISVTGAQIDGLDSKAELAHRIMLINLMRMLGYIKSQKQQRGFLTSPTGVILPLSPNHGTFGGDGFYGEAKIGLETLFNRCRAEDFIDYLSICGAVIGWTRGTGLMAGNNIVAEAMESHGILTFSQSEMAFNILSLMTPAMSLLYEEEPLYVDLGGNLHLLEDMKEKLTAARSEILTISKARKLLKEENVRQELVLRGPKYSDTDLNISSEPLANIKVGYPTLSDHSTITARLKDLRGMVDLRRTVVVVGYSDLSPWGSSRTRFEMETAGTFTDAGFIEMAWIMGLLKHSDGEKSPKDYVGWLDSKTGEPVQDHEVAAKYGEHILKHSGVRLIESALCDGYNPQEKEFLQEVVVEEDMPDFEASKSSADAFRLRHGDKVNIRPIEGSDMYSVQLKKGSHFMLPKAVPFDREVAGQLPTGWNPKTYGIPEDIVAQVDSITLYVLCCVCQAFSSAGIEDPYELYRHMHVSEVANCLGTGAGGLKSMRGVYRDRYLEHPVQSDILQESFLNAMGAWTNMLFLASAGPIKSPTGTCATGVESMDSGCEAIQTGTSKIALVGGTDDFREEMSYEFAKMKATSSTEMEYQKGRLPSEMSRPSTTSRDGFMESAGCGVQILMNAELALKLGLPIYGILAYTQMAGDRAGRSVPAPGQGIMTGARETANAKLSPLLDLEYRRSHLKVAVNDILRRQKDKLQHSQHVQNDPLELDAIKESSDCEIRNAQNMWGNQIRSQNPDIAPMRAALATWGLGIDDIQVATLHGTSTKANDKNEAGVINQQMTHLGRSQGNPLYAISQKYLTGHPKGAAGSWMFNGALQVLETGLVPGNRNLDDVDEYLRRFNHIVYPSQTIATAGIKAFMLTSFGFGQKGGLVIGIAPRVLFSAVDKDVFDAYRIKVTARQQRGQNVFIKGMMTNSIFQAKAHSPWQDDNESQVFLDPKARVIPQVSSYAFDGSNLHPKEILEGNILDTFGYQSFVPKEWSEDAQIDNNLSIAIGIDTEDLPFTPTNNEVFIQRNYTTPEITYCRSSADVEASFAGLWTAKEAAFKSLRTRSKGASAMMKDIEIHPLGNGPAARVELHGQAKVAADENGITDVKMNITYSSDSVLAVALSMRQKSLLHQSAELTRLYPSSD